jgi:hypothetical protein
LDEVAARQLARDLAEQLYAQIENDPLIGGSGAPLDPAASSLAVCHPSKCRLLKRRRSSQPT